jgi:2-polyprenyl-6-methoxyphenol hydroxylase-like FAD-dependent oxidoreductase
LPQRTQVETIKAKYLIGCDGAHSWTRKQLNIPVEVTTLPAASAPFSISCPHGGFESSSPWTRTLTVIGYAPRRKPQRTQVETIKAKYLIGCDGAHSWTRKQLNIPVVTAVHHVASSFGAIFNFLSARRIRIILSVDSDLDTQVETIKAKYLIGCDGAHSWTRKQLNIPVEGSNTRSAQSSGSKLLRFTTLPAASAPFSISCPHSGFE